MSDPHLSDAIFGEEEERAHGAHPATRARRRRRHRGPVGCIITLLVVAAVAAAAVLSIGQLKPLVKDMFAGAPDYAAADVLSTKKSVTIASGQSAGQIGNLLEKAAIVKSAEAFKKAAGENPEWQKMQPGEYEIAQHSPAKDVVAYLVDPKHKIQNLVTVREGLRKWEVYALLSQKTGHPVAEYEAAEGQAAALGLPPAAKGDIEGWLFPSSYDFSKKTPAADQLKAMVAKAVSTTTGLGIAPDKLERTMTIASIIEAEGRRDEDRPKIARVLENRLAKGMQLQLDSTVVYPFKKRVLETTDEERDARNDYNTYRLPGLPKGPISNPGIASIKGALNPADGPWLYFVAVNPSTGETKFASTFEEHGRYVAEWQAFCKAHKGSC